MLTLTDKDLKRLVADGVFKTFDDISLMDYIQPASIDIPIGSVAYEMQSNVIPSQRLVSDVVKKYARTEIDLSQGVNLKKGTTYFIPVGECNLPSNLSARVSPKSSIGRTDLHVRSIIDNYGRMDVMAAGKTGQWWFSAIPNSFGGVHVKSGMALSQVMVFDESLESKLSSTNLEQDIILLDGFGRAVPKKILNKDIVMHLALPENEPVAYKAKKTRRVVDMTQIAGNTFEDFFEPVYASEDGSFTFEKDTFYIMYTKEKVVVPEHLSVEMSPGSHNFGELRIHYAGFFDPGFGINYNTNLPEGASGVLEIRPHESLTVFDGSPICTLMAYENKDRPLSPYGKDGKSNYAGQQGLKAAKYFTQPKF